MFNLQGSEIIVILLLALVVLGPEKLPDAIRRFSRTYAELKKMGTGFQSELKSALDEPMKEMRETADLLQNAADPQKIAEQAEAEAARTAATAAAPAEDEVETKPQGVADPGSETVAVADQPPINQIAAANASAALAPSVESPDEAPGDEAPGDESKGAEDHSDEDHSDALDTNEQANAS